MADGFRSDMPFTETKVMATELYDYKKDPLEKVNVAGEKAYATVTEELKNDMLAYFKSQERKLKR